MIDWAEDRAIFRERERGISVKKDDHDDHTQDKLRFASRAAKAGGAIGVGHLDKRWGGGRIMIVTWWPYKRKEKEIYGQFRIRQVAAPLLLLPLCFWVVVGSTGNLHQNGPRNELTPSSPSRLSLLPK